MAGTDPLNADTNGNGVGDGVEVAAGMPAANTDSDGDGLPDELEVRQGTDPFVVDTDGDGVSDALDAFPLDPLRSQPLRVRYTEKDNGVVQSETNVLWCDNEIGEERGADRVSITRRPFRQGEQRLGVPYFHTMDHLGSVTEVSDSAGALTARHGFDPWGRRTTIQGDDSTGTAFTGHYMHAPSGLQLPLYRQYDADLGLWLSRDPLGLALGTNLYAYVGGNPVNILDPYGLSPSAPGWRERVQAWADAVWHYFLEGAAEAASRSSGAAGVGGAGITITEGGTGLTEAAKFVIEKRKKDACNVNPAWCTVDPFKCIPPRQGTYDVAFPPPDPPSACSCGASGGSEK